MKILSKKTVLLMSALSIFGSMQAQAALDPTGFWYTEGQKAKVELSRCGNTICGKIVSLKEPIDPETKQPKLDKHNPNASLQKRPLIGMQNISGFTPDGEGKWSNGQIYDPKEGKTYSGKMTMTDANKLDVRGYVLGMPFLGRSQIWTRTSR